MSPTATADDEAPDAAAGGSSAAVGGSAANIDAAAVGAVANVCTAANADSTPTDTAAADVADAVWGLLGAIRRLKSRRSHGAGGLGTGEMRILGQLGAVGGVGGATPIGELGRSAGLNAASTSATVDRLEADGLAVRVRDTEDRRVVRVELTPEGRETVARRVAAWQAEWAADLEALPADDLAATARTLTAIAAHLDAR
ncbi:MarR family transcriptional regulator [Patulibacter sp. NPDC049589]|uniref:MarR family winged helix-turn-helix transcriptional regulator n=1 Tax=Patulibacter sp. NPDC049589 TaxID=3154731 RepID=UPI00341A63B1